MTAADKTRIITPMKKFFLLFALLGSALSAPLGAADAPAALPPIDRHALVTRHDPVLHEFATDSPFSVGNGEFCFTVDATGLQTFPDAYASGIPLCTMSDWGWHSFPNTDGFTMGNYSYSNYDTHGRMVGYARQSSTNPASNFLRENPHRFNLGQIGFVLTKADGTPAQPADITDIAQTLDLWDGVINSHFKFEGQPVDVQTICLPVGDTVAVHVVSPLVGTGHLAVQLHFPYGSQKPDGSDWDQPDAHTTQYAVPDFSKNAAVFTRTLDAETYTVLAAWSPGGTMKEVAQHQFVLTPAKDADAFEFTCDFSAQPPEMKTAPSFAEAKDATQKHWNNFWSTGGAIDLSLSKDPRWMELERRIVLSEYLTAIQSAGKNPPAETGLTMNSWYGKFHMEMYWWHDAHFALWGRAPLLENSLGYYQRILPVAEANAQRQGYAGARWPKMTDPSGTDSPSSVGTFLIWQQPHPIYLAELDYRAHPDQATLEKFKDVIFATADFMTSFAWWDDAKQRYELGPPMKEAQEALGPEGTMFNPTYELTYWRWALETAQQWRLRLGLARDANWDKVLKNLSPAPVADGKYLFTESTPDSYTNPAWRRDHPAVVNALGVLPGPGIDPAVMKTTFDWIWQNWNWPSTWGWDYPAMAMCAARLGEPDRAVASLLLDTPKNHYAIDGHNYQRSPDLPLYLPGNGGLLTAVAMMAAGWDGAPARNAPGFPDDGQWVVRWENLQKLP
jgi:protein-glucosylgalactosylhydroxylysine glucosidase